MIAASHQRGAVFMPSFRRKSFRSATAVVCALLATGLMACGGDDGGGGDGGGGSGGTTSVSVMMPVKDVTQFHSFYLADKLGYFEDEGLDVKLNVADGSSAALQQLVAGNTDAAVPAPAPFLQAVSTTGQDLRWVYQYQYNNIFGMIALADSGITSVEDLAGKKVGISELSGGEVPLVRGVLRNAGLKENEDYELVPVGEGSALTVDALKTGKVDAYSSSLPDIAAIEVAGIDVNTILPKEVAGFPGDGLVVTANYLDSNEETVARLTSAITKATAYADANRDAAFKLAKGIAPEEFEDDEFAQAAWDVATDLRTLPNDLQDAPAGSFDQGDWQAYQDFLLKGSEEEGGLANAVDLDTALDPRVLGKGG